MNNLPGTRSWASRAAVKRAHAFPGLRVAETCSSQLLQSSSTPSSWASPNISKMPLSCSMIYGTIIGVKLSHAVRSAWNFHRWFLPRPKHAINSESAHDVIYLASVYIVDELSESLRMSVWHTHRCWISRRTDSLRSCEVFASAEIETVWHSIDFER